ncbi:MAG: TrmB family transcriptional regulator [Candidatus Omnitrophica bacterium]|nr:TrmB family transcriptional regulator [Candidatus Omnitrophota bacterium]
MLTLKTEKQLKNLGLNSYEVKIWTALLSRGVSTAGELSDIANVPRSRSYDVLESLEKKGFVIMKLGKPIKYIAVPPKEVVERVKKNVQEYAKEEIKKISDLKNTDIINELSDLHTQGVELVEPADLSGSLRGRHNLYNHLEYMLNNATRYVLLSTTQKEFANLVETFKPLFDKLKRRSVKIKILTQINNQTKKYVNEISKLAEVKHTDNKARFCVVDGKEIVFMILDEAEVHPTYDVGVWVNTPFAKDLVYFTQNK